MVFFVNVAADLYGRKENLRIEFPICPTVTELINECEAQFDPKARVARPAGYPDIPFRIQSFQVYDDVLMRWVDLYGSSQLSNGCQVYAFQPETVWNVDVQGTIPVARDTLSYSATVGSPRRGIIARDLGVAPITSEKIRSVFYDLDLGNKGYILYSDFRSACVRYGVEFSPSNVGFLFDAADTNRDGHITYEEFVRFAIQFPHIIDSFFFRSRDLSVARSVYIPTTEEIISQRRAREIELDRIYREANYSASRARAQREYEEARRAAEAARAAAAAAVERERSILNSYYYYTPASPRYGYRSP